MASNDAELAPLVAVVGCDGSGKSTLSAALIDWLGQQRPVTKAYLGLGSGNIGNKIKAWPWVGPRFEAYLSRKAGQARKKEAKIPGVATALVIFGFSLLRYRRFRKMMAQRRRGVTIVTERYPQIDVPGFFDGPGLAAARAEGVVVRWLAAREMALYQGMVAYLPDLVIRLNVDADTAFARKPDHKPASLAAKVAATPLLRFNGAPIVDFDGCTPFDVVFAQAQHAVTDMLASR